MRTKEEAKGDAESISGELVKALMEYDAPDELIEDAKDVQNRVNDL